MTRVGLWGASELAGEVSEAEGEPVSIEALEPPAEWGVALRREWFADSVQVFCSASGVEALLTGTQGPERAAGALIAALRLRLPLISVAPPGSPLDVALAALGFAPLKGENPGELAVGTAVSGGPSADALVSSFSLSNALRAGISAGGGPEVILHLSAIAREGGEFGFSRMMRVLVPETVPLVTTGSLWFERHGVTGLLAHLGDTLQESATVTGWLKDQLPSPPESPPETSGARILLVEGRGSGLEALCGAPGGETEELSGYCRVFLSEERAVREVTSGRVEEGAFLVVGGCGPRGGGLRQLDLLREALRDTGLESSVAVFTDGLFPGELLENSCSLAVPEAASGGVLGKLRDGDFLRVDLGEKRLRTGVRAEKIRERDNLAVAAFSGESGYAGRYARSALSALEGGGFG